ncbi:enoyl-CoA hydratase family protein [Tistrella sp. BH-R2-4]|uniref:Enoyl-CoA hydratase family protein n=1 Tax=Tistrella arctica TaxID=3133430 RepID=A0ABU9YM21_9PROT
MSDQVTHVLIDRRDGVATLTLDGAQTRNALGPDVYVSVQAHLLDAEQDPDVRAIVLTGAGGFFSSGGNVRALKASGQSSLSAVTGNTDRLNAMIKAVTDGTKPVIAAVEGGASGAGFSLCLACDLIVASETAVFSAAYVRVGLSPDGGATYFLRRALPRQLVSEICMFGQSVPAERLAAAGLVNHLVPQGQARARALDLAARLAAGPSAALGTIKRLIGAAEVSGLAAQLDDEARAINLARFGPEAAEGLAAFLEKRRPDFG